LPLRQLRIRLQLRQLADLLAVLAALPMGSSINIYEPHLPVPKRPATVLNLNESRAHYWRQGFKCLYIPSRWTQQSFPPLLLRALALSPRSSLTSFSIDGSSVSVSALLAALAAHRGVLTCLALRSLIFTSGNLLDLIHGLSSADFASLDRLVIDAICPAPASAAPREDGRKKISNAEREATRVEFFEVVPTAHLSIWNVTSLDWEEAPRDEGGLRQAYKLEGRFASMEVVRGSEMGLETVVGSWP